MKSIMQDHKECYLTGSTNDLHKHHVFGGANRSNSEKYGCWIWLRSDWHNMSNYGVHTVRKLDLAIKQDTQAKVESIWGHALFLKVFGKNYL